MKNPTNPDSATESSASSQLDATLMPSTTLATAALLNVNGANMGIAPALTTAAPTVPANAAMIGGVNYGDTNFDFFDPQNWMLDGLVDFNLNFPAPLESA